MKTTHVYPLGDLAEHDTRDGSTTCICGPRLEVQCPACSGDPGCPLGCNKGWLPFDSVVESLSEVMVIHHSLDGREQREETRT